MKRHKCRAPKTGFICLLLLVSFSLLPASIQAGTINYTHDAAGRLTGAGYSAGKFIGYTYDNAGNLTLRQFAVIGVGDSDGDGMDDAWEFDYFQTLARDGTGDFDADGMTDLDEFRAGTDPTSAASSFRIIGVTPTPGSSTLLEWNSVAGKRYRVQYRNPITGPWMDVPGDVVATGSTSSKVDNTMAGVTERYYRVALVMNTPPPPLSIVRTNNNQVLISWPSPTPASFLLETTTNLTPVVVWTAVPEVPADNGTINFVILNIEPQPPARLFRLRQ